MDLIKQNPYRVLGVLVNSSERQLLKQTTVIKRYLEVGKSKTFDYDFDFIGTISRESQDIQLAASSIEQPQGKINYALFWFINETHFDEIALNRLKDGDTEKAIDVWQKTLRDDITPKNYSSYQNLSTLYIASAIASEQLDLHLMEMGVELKAKLLKSNHFSSFVESVCGQSPSVEQQKVTEHFVDNIIGIVDPLLGSNKLVKTKRIIKLFNGFTANIQKYVVEKYTEEPLLIIEKEIDKADEKRRADPASSDKAGENLYQSVAKHIDFLKTLLGPNDLQVQMIVDKAANEVMQCAIAYWNEWINSDKIDPGDDALRIANYAKSLGPAGRVKKRIDENAEPMQERVDEKPSRDLQEKVSGEVARISRCIDRLEEVEVDEAEFFRFQRSTLAALLQMKHILGADDDFYSQSSSRIATLLLQALIEIFNREQEVAVKQGTGFAVFKSTVDWIVPELEAILKLDMDPEVRKRVLDNKSTIMGIKMQVDSAVKKSSGACYIATMAYGDYDHHQVVRLRHYRDQVLLKTACGRIFIAVYYATSPYLVRCLGGRKRTNGMIRKLLDKWIEVISE